MLHRHTPSKTLKPYLRKNYKRNKNVVFKHHQKSKDKGKPQVQKQVPVSDGRITDYLCLKWNEYNHIAWYWPSASYTNNSNNETEQKGCTGVGCAQFVLSQRSNGKALINKDWMLLDKCSTESVFWYQYLIDKIKDCHAHEWYEIFTNGGSQRYTKIALLKLLSAKVHYNSTSLANNISLKDEAGLNVVTVTMDTSKQHAINSSLSNGNTLVIKKFNDGLYNLKINNINKGVMA